MKRIADSGKGIGILIPQIISVDEVKKFRDVLGQVNFSMAKLGIMIETPAAVQIIDELCDENIKFISFGTNDLTQYTLAVDRGNEQVQDIYNEGHPAVLRQIEYVVERCKEKGVETSICGQAGSKKEMVEFLVGIGIDSISVNADVAADVAEIVASVEKNQSEVDPSVSGVRENIPLNNERSVPEVPSRENEFISSEVPPMLGDDEPEFPPINGFEAPQEMIDEPVKEDRLGEDDKGEWESWENENSRDNSEPMEDSAGPQNDVIEDGINRGSVSGIESEDSKKETEQDEVLDIF